jgi:glucans biosynthesis protein C
MTPAANLSTARHPELDWLRTGAFVLLIAYHSGMPFVSWGFHLMNDTSSRALELCMLFVNRWRLPLLFCISGAVVGTSLLKRSTGQFLADRMLRLGLPLIAGMLLFVVPLQIYWERLYKGEITSSFWAFWPSVFTTGPYPEGNLSWHHLWYIVYALVYSLLLAPIARPLARWATGLEILNARVLLIVFGTAMVLGPGLLDDAWPSTHNLIADWANHVQYLLYFLAGFIVYQSPKLLELIAHGKKTLLMLTLVGYVFIYSFIIPRIDTTGWVDVAFGIVWYGMVWTAVLALMAYGRQYFTTRPRWLQLANPAVYPVFILHQPVLITICFFVLPMPWPWALKFLLCIAGTFLGAVLLYLIIREVPPLRPLFGLKYRKVPS